jgi:hypothetical protein
MGRGCGNDGVYTPYLRINVGPGGQVSNTFQVNSAGGWDAPAQEGDYEQSLEFLTGGMNWRVLGADGNGYDLEPRWGDNYEIGDPDSGDAIALAFHTGAEGDSPNLPSMGTGYGCPNNCFPYRQWANGESIQNADIVLWYVASAQTVPSSPYYCWTVSQTQTYPCYMGPMFHPFGPAATPTFTPTSGPTNTPTPAITNTPTPRPTRTPTPRPTRTPAPTRTPTPTRTPQPTRTPTP